MIEKLNYKDHRLRHPGKSDSLVWYYLGSHLSNFVEICNQLRKPIFISTNDPKQMCIPLIFNLPEIGTESS